MNKIFLDLDGTVIDSKMRLYHLFCDLVPQACGMTFDVYWSYKYAGMKHHNILQSVFDYADVAIQQFQIDWMKKIERVEYLEMDTVFPWTYKALGSLQSISSLYLVTDRQSEVRTRAQLKNLNLADFFKAIFVTEKKETKENIIKTIDNLLSTDWVVGDTGHDIRTGQNMGLRTCAVLSGFMDEKHLVEYLPTALLPNIGVFAQYILNWF